MFTRFTILEWLRRKQNDQKTVCELFFVERLPAIFLDCLATGTVTIEESVRKELLDWYISRPMFIQKLCRRSMIDARMMLDSHILGEMSTAA